jgi:putative nucleotidyltransferase with HDIG domain
LPGSGDSPINLEEKGSMAEKASTVDDGQCTSLGESEEGEGRGTTEHPIPPSDEWPRGKVTILPITSLTGFVTSRAERLITAGTREMIHALDAQDNYTLGHSERVTALATHLAASMKVGADQIRTIQLGGMLHDVGKVAVPEDILNKREILTEAEYRTVKSHVKTGFELVRDIEHAEPVACAVRYHHERWDGDGYPDHLEGEDIPLAARFLSVADAFDAMASRRPYRDRLSPCEIAEELRVRKGEQFDPLIVEELMKLYSYWDEEKGRISLVYPFEGTSGISDSSRECAEQQE